MHITGIIAEFNPFHNGHAFFLNKIKQLTNADYIIAVISGDFVQRGMPAIANKYLRTQMALAGGVDFVFELPAVWACSSAEDFARGGIRLLQQLGIVDTIGFGSESGDLQLMSNIASILAEEPKEYQNLLHQFLAAGNSFPSARMLALQNYRLSHTQNSAPISADLLSSPNNILGIEYLKALQHFHSDIEPITIARQGNYHSMEYPQSHSTFAGASLIRQILENSVQIPNSIYQHLPDSTSEIFHQYWRQNTPITMEMYYPYLSLTLLQNETHLTEFADVSPELANRLRKVLGHCTSMEELITALKTRQYTYTRICRALLHVFLEMKTGIVSQWRHQEYIPYARLLGFRRNAAPAFGLLKQQAKIPILSNLANSIPSLNTQAVSMLELDIRAANLYELICRNHWHISLSKNEFSQGIIVF